MGTDTSKPASPRKAAAKSPRKGAGKAAGSAAKLTAQQVRAYLEAHPDVLHELPAPKRELGEGVVDFQHHLLKSLQSNSKTLSQRYDVLVDYCRENLSVQLQVHHAALRIMQARTLEQLLEVLAIDLLSIFDLDVVRLAMESELPLDMSYGEQHYSGVMFVEEGIADALFGKQKQVVLVADAQAAPPVGFEQIFADCEEQVHSCALLRLTLEGVNQQMILALGVRHQQRFHSGQGTELLHFLAQVVALQFDRYIDDLWV